MGDLGSDDNVDQLDRNMWAPEEEDSKEVYSMAIYFSEMGKENY